MDMKEENTHIDDLILDYLTGEISEEGKAQLSEWLAASEENMALFARRQEVWMGAGQLVTNFDADRAFSIFRRRTMHKSENDEPKWGECYLSHTREMFQWAAAILMPLLVTSTLYFYLQVKDYFSEQIVVSTIEGQSSTFQLPDGTLILLQQNSRLTYGSGDFSRGKRNVEFSGEAYFNVESDESHPFVITTSDSRITVVGTEFNLKSRDGEKTGVISLDKGKVNIASLKGNSSFKMTEGDEVTINRVTHKMTNRHRTPEEVAESAMARNASHSEHPLSLEGIDKENGNYKMTVVVNKPLNPGIYEMNLSDSSQIAPSSSNNLFQSGKGTASDPYIIATTRQLCNMRYALIKRKLVYFALAEDIDLKGINWKPLNTYYNEYAHWISLDGRNHVIRNLTPTLSCSYSSFFGVLCGECKNVGFEDVNISSVGLGAGVLGGYIGHHTYPGTTLIENCYFTGRVSSKSYAGAIGGNIGGKTIIRGCCSSVDVNSIDSYAGGLIGKVHASLTMEECICLGSVAGHHAGGIVGGGYDSDTPTSRFTDVIACNRSVYGTLNSDAFGFTDLKATKRNVFHAKGTFLNGNCLNDGLSTAQLKEKRDSWRRQWYRGRASR